MSFGRRAGGGRRAAERKGAPMPGCVLRMRPRRVPSYFCKLAIWTFTLESHGGEASGVVSCLNARSVHGTWRYWHARPARGLEHDGQPQRRAALMTGRPDWRAKRVEPSKSRRSRIVLAS